MAFDLFKRMQQVQNRRFKSGTCSNDSLVFNGYDERSEFEDYLERFPELRGDPLVTLLAKRGKLVRPSVSRIEGKDDPDYDPLDEIVYKLFMDKVLKILRISDADTYSGWSDEFLNQAASIFNLSPDEFKTLQQTFVDHPVISDVLSGRRDASEKLEREIKEMQDPKSKWNKGNGGKGIEQASVFKKFLKGGSTVETGDSNVDLNADEDGLNYNPNAAGYDSLSRESYGKGY